MFIDIEDKSKNKKNRNNPINSHSEINDFGNGNRAPSESNSLVKSFDFPLSSRGYRLIAHLIEGFLIGLTLFIGWLIWSMFTWKEGTTPGHKVIGQKVIVYKTGQSATWGRMLLREVGAKLLLAILSFFTFGIPIIVDNLFIFRKDRRTLHDLIAGTIVVNDPEIAIFQP